MPVATINDVQVKGIACAVPKRRETESDLAAVFGEKESRRLVKGTGVSERRVDLSLCTSDLCFSAADSLLDELGWERDSIDHLIFLSQSPDYHLPATACILQDRLELSTDCSAFDVNLGCSGYPYGLWLAGKLLEPGQRSLLLVGDTQSKYLAEEDRSTIPLFGDAGSATALECSVPTESSKIFCSFGTDGAGSDNIIIKNGGFRAQCDKEYKRGEIYMDGAEVFGFAIQRVGPLIENILNIANWTAEECDDFIFHQANGFMLKHIAEKAEIPLEKIPMSLNKFGNNSSASIPLTLVTERAEELRNQSRNYVMVGFGVGWSWGAAAIKMGSVCVPDLIEIDSL